MSKARTAPHLLEETRGRRLMLTVRLSAWWLMAQGCICLGLTEHLAYACGLRFDMVLLPYLRLAGLSLACLGFFLLKALRDPRRQYLAVDILILFLLGHVYFLVDYRLNAQVLTLWEWFWGAVDLGLAASLVLNRTRSSQMEGAAPLLSERATDLALQTGKWVARKGPAPKTGLGDLAPQGEEHGKGKTRKPGDSEALPFMD